MDKANITSSVIGNLRTTLALTLLFNEGVAAKIGMSLSEMQTIHLLQLQGALTPGDLALATGLTSGSVTALLDRLESLSFVTRAPHPSDRRKVMITLNESHVAAVLAPFYKDKAAHIAAITATFAADELNVVDRFLVALNNQNDT